VGAALIASTIHAIQHQNAAVHLTFQSIRSKNHALQYHNLCRVVVYYTIRHAVQNQSARFADRNTATLPMLLSIFAVYIMHQVALVARNEDVENAQLYYEDTLWGDWAPKQEFKVRMSLMHY
jgi:predicted nucleotide-binding protein